MKLRLVAAIVGIPSVTSGCGGTGVRIYADGETTPIQGTGSYDIFNLSAGYNWDKYSLRFGIDNLFDKQPPIIGNDPLSGDTNSDSTNPGYYDILGRRWFMGLKMTF